MASRLLWVIEEQGDVGAPPLNPNRVFASDDNGLTWSELDTLDSYDLPGGLDFFHLTCDTTTRAVFAPLGGPNGKSPLVEPIGIARSLDQGVTWTGVISPGLLLPTDFWNFHHVLKVSDTNHMALGDGTSHAVQFNWIRSTDGGATFTTPGVLAPTPISIFFGFLDSNGVVWLCPRHTLHALPYIWKSVDSGMTFSQVTVPCTNFIVNSIFQMQAMAEPTPGTLLLVGRTRRSPTPDAAYIAKSTDGGTTWTDVTFSIASLSGSTFATNDAVAVTSSLIAADLEDDPDPPINFRFGRVSTDTGSTFPDVGTYVPAPSTPGAGTDFMCQQMAVADDGSVLVCASTSVLTYEMWRGVIVAGAATWTRVKSVASVTTSGCGLMGMVKIATAPAPPGSPCPANEGNFFPTADQSLINFGNVTLGTTANRTVVLTNHSAPVLPGTITVTTPFATSPASTLSIGGGTTFALTVQFSPTVAGSYSQLLTIATGLGSIVIPLLGTGV